MNGQYNKKKKKKTGSLPIKILVTIVVLLLVCIAGLLGLWWYQQPKFRNLTIELGTDTVGISDFMTRYAWGRMAAFVSDPGQVDLNRVGVTDIVLRHGRKQEQVRLIVRDTTAPTASIPARQSVPVNVPLEAASLVSDVKDLSKTRVYFPNAPQLTPGYGDQVVTIVVEDACGNRVSGTCQLSFLWMKQEYPLELGETLCKEDLLLDPETDGDLLDQAALDAVNHSPVGEYMVFSTTGVQNNTCVVTVQDTRGPELVLKKAFRREGQDGVEAEDFIESVTDRSGVTEVRLSGDYDVNTLGAYPMTLEAEDIYGNITTGQIDLVVANDWDPPEITGDFEELTVTRGSEPDFLDGFTAEDEVSGPCEVTCDTSKLDMSKAGTYYITYRAEDEVGNEAAVKRKVLVEHNEEDTQALVKSVADKLSSNPEKIRDYVRYNLGYSSDWGGNDPVWYGFKNKSGNCYVHALCLKAIFDLKGIENQLIWCTDETHYWLLVKFDSGWKHMDATPGVLHSRYSKMSDKQRLATLGGRKWDTEQWPACS